VTVLESNTIALAVMQQVELAERKDFAGRWVQPRGTRVADLASPSARQTIASVSKNFEVEIVPKTDIITVQFRPRTLSWRPTSSMPRSAAMPNATSIAATTRRPQVSSWLSKQTDDLKRKANEAQEKLAALQKQRGLIGVDETDNVVTTS